MNAWPCLWAFAAFPKQNDKCPTKTRGGGWAHLELTEQLASRNRAASSTGFTNSQARETSEKRERGMMGTSVERDHSLGPRFP